MLYELTRWWSYRRIDHPAIRWYVLWLPIGFTALSIGFYLIFPKMPQLFQKSGIVEAINAIVALLPGFYIAALAAVATFNRPDMDEEMAASPPTVQMRHLGKTVEIGLTRRLFLTLLFSYLTILNFLILGIGWFGVLTHRGFIDLLTKVENLCVRNVIHAGLEIIYLSILLYFFYSMIASTLHGIYFISERMHQPLGRK